MLRISFNDSTEDRITLRLDGQISGRWVDLLKAACDSLLVHDARIALDLTHVSFVDREGTALLRCLLDLNVLLLNPLPFIADQLRTLSGSDGTI